METLTQLAHTPELWWALAAIALLIPSPYGRLIAPLFRWIGDRVKRTDPPRNVG